MTRSFKVAGLLAFTSVTRGIAGVILLTILSLVAGRRAPGAYYHGRDGTDGDNIAAAMPEHVPQSSTGAEKGAGQVHADDALPVSQREFMYSSSRGCPGTGNQYVYAAIFLNGTGGHSLNVLFASNVTTGGMSYAPGRHNHPGCLFRQRRADICDCDTGAFCRQLQRARPPDAAASTRNNSGFSRKSSHIRFSSRDLRPDCAATRFYPFTGCSNNAPLSLLLVPHGGSI